MSVPGNTRSLKESNTERVRSALISLGSATKLAVSNATGLSVATCGNILNSMLESGEITDSGVEESGGGRPARIFSYNTDMLRTLCVRIRQGVGRPELLYEVVNLAGKVLERDVMKPDTLEKEDVELLCGAVVERFHSIKAVSISVADRIVEDIRGMEQRLAGKFPELTVCVERALGLMALGLPEGRGGYACVLSLSGPEPELGLVLEGRILHGSSDFFGKAGFLTCAEKPLVQAADIIAAVTAAADPGRVVVTGALIEVKDKAALTELCAARIPGERMPEISISADMSEELELGLLRAVGAEPGTGDN
ncbi:MAG: hypothetical protein ACI3VB_00830 [Oscillospiraceae bacterium]